MEAVNLFLLQDHAWKISVLHHLLNATVPLVPATTTLTSSVIGWLLYQMMKTANGIHQTARH